MGGGVVGGWGAPSPPEADCADTSPVRTGEERMAAASGGKVVLGLVMVDMLRPFPGGR